MDRLLIASFFIVVFLSVNSRVHAELTKAPVNSGESLIFVFNQPHYSIGDTAYFGVYVQGSFREDRNILQFRLYKGNEEIFRQRIVVQANRGSGYFVFPSSMLPGEYSLISFVEIASKTTSPSVFKGRLSICSEGSVVMQREEVIPQLSEANFVCSPDREKYLTRSNVRLDIINNNKVYDKERDFVVVVYKENLFNKTHQMTLAWSLTSYLDTTHLRMLSDRPYYFKGRLVDKITGNLVENSARITFFLSKNNLAYEVYTKEDGSFLFPLFRDFGDDVIFYSIYQKDLDSSKTLGLTVDDVDLADKSLLNDKLVSCEWDLPYTSYAKQVKLINESYSYFVGTPKDQSNNREKKAIQVDHEIFLNRYESFLSMAEVIVNIVPMVRYKNDVEGVRVFLQSTAGYGVGNPLFLVDGVMTSDVRYVLQMNPLDIKRIGIIRTARALTRFGDLGRNGILVIDTNLKNKAPEYEENTIRIVGVEPPLLVSKHSNSILREDKRRPVFRPSLYWNPSVKVKSGQKFSTEFYTTDDIGDYVIELISLGKDGIFNIQKRITVEKTNNH